MGVAGAALRVGGRAVERVHEQLVRQLGEHLAQTSRRPQLVDEALGVGDGGVAPGTVGDGVLESGEPPGEERPERRRLGPVQPPPDVEELPFARRLLEARPPEQVRQPRLLHHEAQRPLDRLGGPQHSAEARLRLEQRYDQVAVESIGAEQRDAAHGLGELRRIFHARDFQAGAPPDACDSTAHEPVSLQDDGLQKFDYVTLYR